jgi:drug/metabolite transporter (DMT)-like permease
MSGPFTPNASPLRLIVTGVACLVGGVVLANAPRLFSQFDNPLIDSAALIAGVLIGLAGALTLVVAIILVVASARR